MNHQPIIPQPPFRLPTERPARDRARLAALAGFWAAALASAPLAAQGPDVAPGFSFDVRYDVELVPEEDRANVSITIGEGAHNVVWLRLNTKPHRHSGFTGDGEIATEGRYVTWTPPDDGGTLSYAVQITHRRGNAHDARMTRDWALFRGDDLVPPIRIRKEEFAESDATLRLTLPEGWSFVAPYPEVEDQVFAIEHLDRGLDRPTGWMLAGRLGVRRERIAKVRVAVAGPLNEGVRRMDILAFLNWNLPRLKAIVPEMPAHLAIVSARDEMWRGGLSGPSSLYIHADRPLISENGTSTLLHELVHVFTGLQGGDGGDWVVEGLAEYYSLKLMWRSGTITKSRYDAAFEKLGEWAKKAKGRRLDGPSAIGPMQARAVLIMRDLDREIYRATGQKDSLDEVVKLLVEAGGKVDTASFDQAVTEVMGGPSETLADAAGDIGLE
jgi:hypothetical protein